jgi:hypothetical protein
LAVAMDIQTIENKQGSGWAMECVRWLKLSIEGDLAITITRTTPSGIAMSKIASKSQGVTWIEQDLSRDLSHQV